MNNAISKTGLFVILILMIAGLFISAIAADPEISTFEDPVFFSRFIDSENVFNQSNWSIFFASIVMAATGMLLMYLNNRITSGMSQLVPIIYLVLCLANPRAIFLTPVHLAAFLVAASLLMHINYSAVRPSLDQAFGSWFFLAFAAFFYAPVLWLAPMLFALGVSKADDKGKYTLIFIIGLTLPLAVACGIEYLARGTEDAMSLIPEYYGKTIILGHKNISFSLASISRILLTVVAAGLATSFILKNLGGYKIVQYRSYVRIILFCAATFLVIVLFFRNSLQPLGLLAGIPLALMFNEYFWNSNNSRQTHNLLAIAFILLIVERIAIFF